MLPFQKQSSQTVNTKDDTSVVNLPEVIYTTETQEVATLHDEHPMDCECFIICPFLFKYNIFKSTTYFKIHKLKKCICISLGITYETIYIGILFRENIIVNQEWVFTFVVIKKIGALVKVSEYYTFKDYSATV